MIILAHDDYGKGGSSMAGSAIAGALFGATVVALLHKPTRDKVKAAFSDVKQTGEEKLDEVKDKMGEIQQKGKRKISQALGEAQDKFEGAEGKSQKAIYKAKRKLNEI
ncbi:hypothetical protein KW795_02845 [Candidatus Microgenomates bacterium]|nr:hypothetical protein [Candidatus Microgenomates bacterium]